MSPCAHLCHHVDCCVLRDGDVDNGKESHAHIVDQELASIESLIKQRSEVQKLKSDEAQALAEEDYELAEELSRQLERRELLSEWTVVSKGLGAVSWTCYYDNS